MRLSLSPLELSPLGQRACALLLLGLAMALVYWGALEPWLVTPHRAISEQMADLRQAQRRYVALLGEREALQAQVAAANTRQPGEDSLLAGDDASSAAATLLQRGAQAVARHQDQGPGCELLNRAPLTEDPGTAPYARVQASFSLNCGIQPLEAILFELESGQPVLFVSQLRIERRVSETGPGERLAVQLTLEGYQRQPPAAPVAPEEDGP